MPTRLLAIDIDGTLLTHERVPHPENILAVRRAMDAGITVVPASGRMAASIRPFSQTLGLDETMIACNGAFVQGSSGQTLLQVGLSAEAAGITFDYAIKNGVHTNAYTRDRLFYLSDSNWGDMYRLRVSSTVPEIASVSQIRDLNLLKLILIDDPAVIQKHRKALEVLLPTDIASLTESEPEYLEILSPDANKGIGLKALSDSLGVRQEETAAIGDYLNDLEMIRWAGIGAAMGNAIEDVKAVANIVVSTNDGAGVAQFIDYLIARNLDKA